MKPLNYKERKSGLLQFILVFGITIIFLFITGFLTLKTGESGIDVLDKRHSRYTDIFRKKAALAFEIEEIIKHLHQINNKERNLSQHKKYQTIISRIRDGVTKSINEKEKNEENNPEDFIIYTEMIQVIKAIQSDLDTYKEDQEQYDYLEDLLERCKEKYIEEQERKEKEKK